MEKKCYTLHNIDCANCAAKIERAIAALPQAEGAELVFATRKLYVTAQDPDALLPQMQEIADRIEPGCTITDEHGQSHCRCQEHHCQAHGHHMHPEHHEHDHEHEHSHGTQTLVPILLGAGLFAAGIGLSMLHPIAGLAAYLAAYGILGLQVLVTAGKNILRGQIFDENFLMSIATLAAFAIGEFPEAVGIMLFYRVGEYFQDRAVSRSRSQILSAGQSLPENVILASGQTIPAAQAKPGDIYLVRPGDRILLDGVVVEGSSQLDTSPITGEPVPQAVNVGDPVTSGCINTLSQLHIRAEKPLSDATVTRILRAMESAAAGKPAIQRFITRFAAVYTPVVVCSAAAVALIGSLATGNWSYWCYTAISFLVMSCPCALVLSVPLSYFSAIGAGSKKGILFKDSLTLEALANVKAVAMDKTGTLTRGDFQVQQVEGDVLALCAACEVHSSHPLAGSIVAHARCRGIAIPEGRLLEELPGHGVHGLVGSRRVLCGSAALLERFGVAVPQMESKGTAVLVAVDGSYAGRILLWDRVKEEAAEAVDALHKANVTTAMLTGDREAVARSVGKDLGIREVFSRLLPQDKLSVVQELRRKYGPVMFVGDGINDAPVLAGADVGAAMGSGADAAIEAADVVFLTPRADAIGQSLSIARAARRITWENVLFALGFKLLVMLLGLLGFAQLWLAVFADTGVAILCVLNSIRLLCKK